MKKISRQKKVLRIVLAGLLALICLFGTLTFSKLRTRRLDEIVDISCTPICIYGIQPGVTTVELELDKLSAVSFPWQLEIVSNRSDSLSHDHIKSLNESGTIRWGRDLRYPFLGEYSKTFDRANFRRIDLSSPKIVSMYVTADKTFAKTLKDYIDVFGPPSHIWPYTGQVWPSPENRLRVGYEGVGAALIYEDRGFEIRLSLVPKSMSQNLLIENANVDIFVSSVIANSVPENRDYDLSITPRWQGYKDFYFYCSQIPQSVSQCL